MGGFTETAVGTGHRCPYRRIGTVVEMQPTPSHVNGRACFVNQSNEASPADALTLTLELSGEQLDAIAESVAVRLRPAPLEHATPWLNTADAAAYLAAKPARLHDLVQLGRLTPRRDGRRLLFHRSDLDAYLEASV
jgi:excisionase family DNA binding protein